MFTFCFNWNNSGRHWQVMGRELIRYRILYGYVIIHVYFDPERKNYIPIRKLEYIIIRDGRKSSRIEFPPSIWFQFRNIDGILQFYLSTTNLKGKMKKGRKEEEKKNYYNVRTSFRETKRNVSSFSKFESQVASNARLDEWLFPVKTRRRVVAFHGGCLAITRTVVWNQVSPC